MLRSVRATISKTKRSPKPAVPGYVKEGVTDTVILWKMQDLGYLAIEAASALAKGELKPGATTFKSKRAGDVEIQGDNILLGKPLLFTKENIDQFDF